MARRLTAGVRLRAAEVGGRRAFGGCQASSTASVMAVGRHASGVSVVAWHHRAPWHGGRGLGVPLPRPRARLGSSVPCGRPLCRRPGATGVRGARHADRGLSCGCRTVSPASPAAGGARCGGPGVSVASWHGLGAVPTGCCWRQPVRRPDGGRPSHHPGVGVDRRPQGLARRGGRSRAGGGWTRAGAGSAPRMSLPRPQGVRCTGPCPASPGVAHGRRGVGVTYRPSHACVCASPTYPGSGGRRAHERHPARRVSRVRRG